LLSEQNIKAVIPIILLKDNDGDEEEETITAIITATLDWVITDGIGSAYNPIAGRLSKYLLTLEETGMKDMAAEAWDKAMQLPEDTEEETKGA
jgi:hypothetical protein